MAHNHHSHCDCCSHEHHHEHHDHEHGSLKNSLILIAITSVLLAVAVIIEKTCNLATWQLLLIYLVPFLLIGHDTLKEAAEGLAHGDAFNEHFLMSIATIGALCIGFLPGAETQFPEAVFVMLFFQVGELFEGYAEGKSRESIAHLMDIRPDIANVERDGKVLEVSPEQIKVGEIIVIKPGEKVPLDGVVVEGATALNTVALTGETVPRDACEGDEVISGCVNLSGVIKVRTTKSFGESTVSKIIDLVEHSSDKKSKAETFISRFARIYTPVVVLAAVLLAVVPLCFGGAFHTWLYRALMFLIVSCPCALVISVPLAFFGGIGGASRQGILIKGASYMDVLAQVGTVVFDKTGTLTHGQFEVSAVHPGTNAQSTMQNAQCTMHNAQCKMQNAQCTMQNAQCTTQNAQCTTQNLSPLALPSKLLQNNRHLLHLAAHVEHFSTHPIGAALRDAFPDEATDGCSVTDVEEIAGQGVRATVGGDVVCVGNTRMMEAVGAQWQDCTHIGTIIHVAINGEYAGHIVINDKIKQDSKQAIADLKATGVQRIVMLTGDRSEVAQDVATKLGIDEHYAQLMPADKVAHVEQLLGNKSKGKALAFVGDGINDAPVLARADVGIAMGGLGSDAAIEAADVVLMDDKPTKIARAIAIARRTLSIARQNVWFAIGVKLAVLALATFGIATMWMAVFADVGVTVLAVINSMRALNSMHNT